MDRPGHYRCDHCESLFLHQDTKKPRVASGVPVGGGRASPIIGVAMIVGVLGAGVAIYATVTESQPDPEPPTPSSAADDIRKANAERMKAVAAEREARRAATVQTKPEPEPEDRAPRSVDEILDPDLITSEPEPEPEPEPIRIEAYQPLSGCECKADLDGDGRRESIQLALKASIVGTWITSSGTSREVAYDFIVRPKKAGSRFVSPWTRPPPHPADAGAKSWTSGSRARPTD